MKAAGKIKTIFIIIALLLPAVLGGLYLPAYFLDKEVKGYSDTVNEVPKEYYLGEHSATAAMASAQMSEYEKIRLIGNVFEGESKSVAIDYAEDDTYGLVQLVKDKLRDYYRVGLYPTSFDGQNGPEWYKWDVTKYCSTDATFNTFSTYYWKVELTKYDFSQYHTILITEDGTVLYAKCRTSTPSKGIVDISRKYRSIPLAGTRGCSFIPVDGNTEIPTYPEVKFADDKQSMGILVVGSDKANSGNIERLRKRGDNTTNAKDIECYYVFQSNEYKYLWITYELGIVPYAD